MEIFKAGSTNVVTLSGLFDSIDRAYEQGATVAYTLLDSAASPIAGAANVAMPQVAGTSGKGTLYRSEVAHTVPLPAGTSGTLVITATAVSGKVRKFPEAARYES